MLSLKSARTTRQTLLRRAQSPIMSACRRYSKMVSMACREMGSGAVKVCISERRRANQIPAEAARLCGAVIILKGADTVGVLIFFAYLVPPSILFALTGEYLNVEWRHGAGRGIEQQSDRLIVQAPDDSAARALLQGWLKSAAQERLVPQLLQLASELKYPVSRVSIRCQRTRWGSCSTRGTVSLNCSLVFLRPDVVRYLFIHELAHTKHMNHSANFWRLVEKLEPDYRRLDRELLAGWRTVPAWVFKN